jgi:hypothetical protein
MQTLIGGGDDRDRRGGDDGDGTGGIVERM